MSAEGNRLRSLGTAIKTALVVGVTALVTGGVALKNKADEEEKIRKKRKDKKEDRKKGMTVKRQK